MIVTSNLAFSRWGETLGDDVVAAATIDRLVRHAQVIALDGESYRSRADAADSSIVSPHGSLSRTTAPTQQEASAP